MSPVSAAPFPVFPGGVGVSRLAVYPWAAADGEHGGTPHMHLACSECYVIVSGRGRLETLTMTEHAMTPLEAGDIVWFEPGTIHRAINDGDLVAVIVMQNGGLPEAGDAVMTFPPQFLGDRETYNARVELGSGSEQGERARARRDLAISGFQRLTERFDAGDTEPLRAFHRAAADLVRPELDAWRRVVADGAAKEAAATVARIDELAASGFDLLAAAQVAHIAAPDTTLGMCGRLNAYDRVRRGL